MPLKLLPENNDNNERKIKSITTPSVVSSQVAAFRQKRPRLRLELKDATVDAITATRLVATLREMWNYGKGIVNTVKLARAKLPANAGNFTCSSQVKRSLAQFTCVTCSLPVITEKFTCFEAASTSRRTHAHCLRSHVNLPEYHRYFTGSFTCGTHANLPATSMQNCLLLQAKIHATYKQKHWNRR